MWSNRWKKGEDYPEWASSEVYKKTIQGGYLLEDETPRQAYRRVAKTVANRLQKKEMEEVFLITSGKVGSVLLALCLVTLVLIKVFQ